MGDSDFVQQWLREVNEETFAEKFKENALHKKEDLFTLTEEDLKGDEFQLRMGDRRRLLWLIDGLKAIEHRSPTSDVVLLGAKTDRPGTGRAGTSVAPSRPKISESLPSLGERSTGCSSAATSAAVHSTIPTRDGYRDIEAHDKRLTQISSQISEEVLKLVHAAYFAPYPQNEESIQLWVRAFKTREKIFAVKGCGAGEVEKFHQDANDAISQALSLEFWLPIRHAAMWFMEDSTLPGVVLHRLEYDVLMEMISSCDKDQRPLPQCVEQVRNEVMQIYRDGCVSGTCRTIQYWSPKKQCDPSHIHGPGCYDVGGRFFCDPKCTDSADSPLPVQLKHMEISLLVKCVTCWPSVDTSDTSPDWARNIFHSTRANSYFGNRSFCDFLSPDWTRMADIWHRLMGGSHTDASLSNSSRSSLKKVFYDLRLVRSGRIHDSHGHVDAIDIWQALSATYIATDIAIQQAAKWIVRQQTSHSVETGLPSEQACLRFHEYLITTAMPAVLEVASCLEREIPQDVTSHCEDQFDVFLRSVNRFEAGGPFLLLIIPPLPYSDIPPCLSLVKWNAVVDFTESGKSVESAAWQALTRRRTDYGFSHRCGFSAKRVMRGTFESKWQADMTRFLQDESGGVPWWQPESEVEHYFNTDGTVTDRDGVSFIERGFSVFSSVVTQFLQGRRRLQIVIPMYNKFEAPCLYRLYRDSFRWYFPGGVGTNPSNPLREYSFAYFLPKMLTSLTAVQRSGCLVLARREMSFSSTGKMDACRFPSAISPFHDCHSMSVESKKRFLKNDERNHQYDGLFYYTELKFVYLAPEILEMRSRLHEFVDASITVSAAVRIPCDRSYSVPFVRPSELELSETSACVSDDSWRNWRKLMACGMELLHLGSGDQSLEEFQGSTLMAQRASSSPHTTWQQFTPQALAVLMFYFSKLPAWALFCMEIMRRDPDLPEQPVILRSDAMESLESAIKPLCVNMGSGAVIVTHPPMSGGSTAVRQFVWLKCFREWKMVVINLTSTINSCSLESLTDAIVLLKCCLSTHSTSPIVVLADRNVLPCKVSRVLQAFKDGGIYVIFIRVQHQDSSEDESIMKGLKLRKVALKNFSDPVEFEIAMLKMARYVEPGNHRIQEAISEKCGNMGNVSEPVQVKKLYFLGLLRMAAFADGGKIDSRNERHRNYRDALNSFVTPMLRGIEAKVNQEISSGSRASSLSALSILRCLCYLALVQCSIDHDYCVSLDSLWCIFEDSKSHQWLFDSWSIESLEQIMFRSACDKLRPNSRNRVHSFGEASHVWNALLPFEQLIDRPAEYRPEPEPLDFAPELTPKYHCDLSHVFTAVREQAGDSVSAFRNYLRHAGPQDVVERVPATDATDLQTVLQQTLSSWPDTDGNEHDSESSGSWDALSFLQEELIEIRGGCIRFISQDVAEVFLQMVMELEMKQAPSSVAITPRKDSSLETVPAECYYLLAMSLLRSLSINYSVEESLSKYYTHANASHQPGDNAHTYFPWLVHIMLTERSMAFDDPRFELREGLQMKRDRYRQQNQRWSWALLRLSNSSDNALYSLPMKLLLASQAVYANFWVVSTTYARLVQYRMLSMCDELRTYRQHIYACRNSGSCGDQLLQYAEYCDNVFANGVSLFLSGIGRLLMTLQEIRSSKKDAVVVIEDREKLSGSFVLLGNTVKSFLSLSGEATMSKFVLLKCNQQRFLSRTEATELVQQAITWLVALGNIARLFYSLSTRAYEQPTAWGDEIDCWLRVLYFHREFCDILQLDGSTTVRSGFDNIVKDVSKVFEGGERWVSRLTGQINTTVLNQLLDIQKPPPPLLSIDAICDECPNLIETFHVATLDCQNDSDPYQLERNWESEGTFLERLAKVGVGGRFSFDQFNRLRSNVDQLAQNDPSKPLRQRRLCSHVFLWWTSMLELNDRSESAEQVGALQRSALWHSVMTEMASQQSSTMLYVMSCASRSMAKIQLKYPCRLMVQLFELAAYVYPVALNHLPHDFVTYPYPVQRLLSITGLWIREARTQFAAGSVDTYSLLCALRFRCLLSFVLIWWHSINPDVPPPHDLQDSVRLLAEENGHVNSESKLVKGQLEVEFKARFSLTEKYVLCPPQNVNQCVANGVVPLSIRRQFSIAEEAHEESRAAMQLVQGKVVSFSRAENNQSVHIGVVELALSSPPLPLCAVQTRVYLQFQYKSEELFQLNEMQVPIVGHPCTFYISFLPWSIEAYAVQGGPEESRLPLSCLFLREPAQENKLRRQSTCGSGNQYPRVIPEQPVSFHEWYANEPLMHCLTSMDFCGLHTAKVLHSILPRNLLDANKVPSLQSKLYGVVNIHGDLSSPYQGVRPDTSCGLIAVPARMQNKDLLPWLLSTDGSLLDRCRIKRVWRNVTSLSWERTSGYTQLGSAKQKSQVSLNPARVDSERSGLILHGEWLYYPDVSSRDIHVLFFVSTLSLVAVTEGLLALIDNGNAFDLAVISFIRDGFCTIELLADTLKDLRANVAEVLSGDRRWVDLGCAPDFLQTGKAIGSLSSASASAIDPLTSNSGTTQPIGANQRAWAPGAVLRVNTFAGTVGAGAGAGAEAPATKPGVAPESTGAGSSGGLGRGASAGSGAGVPVTKRAGSRNSSCAKGFYCHRAVCTFTHSAVEMKVFNALKPPERKIYKFEKCKNLYDCRDDGCKLGHHSGSVKYTANAEKHYCTTCLKAGHLSGTSKCRK